MMHRLSTLTCLLLAACGTSNSDPESNSSQAGGAGSLGVPSPAATTTATGTVPTGAGSSAQPPSAPGGTPTAAAPGAGTTTGAPSVEAPSAAGGAGGMSDGSTPASSGETTGGGGTTGAGETPAEPAPTGDGAGGVGGSSGMGEPSTGGQGGLSGAGGSTEPAGAAGTVSEAAGGQGGEDGDGPPYCETTPTTLKEAGECTSRLIGNAASAGELDDANYVAALGDFNYLTPENEMKFDAIEPSPGGFNFSGADAIVDFAKRNGMKVKGHTLVWRYQNPSWLTNMTSGEEVRQAMIRHIEGVMGHYKGNDTVIAWDVVNEAINNEGTGYWDSPFTKIGQSYVDEAFIAAREVDPNVKLYYNDYRADGMNAKSDAIYEMVRSMVERGIPIDGVGVQMHTGTPNVQFPLDEIQENMQRIADLGLEVVISEMDQHVCDGVTPEQQAQYYHDVVSFCMDLPECTAITFWGFDQYSWLNTWNETNCNGSDPSGTLWDKNWMKKPAYYGVLDALQGL